MLRTLSIQLERGDGEGRALKAVIHIENDRVVWGSRFMKWAVGKSSSQARRWLLDKGARVFEEDLVTPSPHRTTPDKWRPVSWWRMGELVVGFQGDTVTRCNDHALIGSSRAHLRRFCREQDITPQYIGTGLREYVWESEGRINFGINPPPSTVYASIPSERRSDTRN